MKVKKIRQLSFEMTKKIARLEEKSRMEEVIEQKLERIKDVPLKKLFAEVVAIPKITGVKRVSPSPKVLMIHSKEGEREPGEVKKIMKEAIKPRDIGINVKRVRRTARGVMIEIENEDQFKKLEGNKDLIRKGLVESEKE